MAGSARIAPYRSLPEILTGFGVDIADVLAAARLPANIFDDPDNQISYLDIGRLLSVSVQLTRCDHIGLLVGRSAHLADMGLAGQIALCADTVGEGLQNFVDFAGLQNTAATLSVITSGGFTRLVYAIAVPGMGDTGQIQLGAMTLLFNILRELCGPRWRPVAITIASSAPSNLRPCQSFFRAPLRFDSDESSLIFASHWLGRPLPLLDPRQRRQVEAAAQERQVAMLADFATIVRHTLRRQLIADDCSMDRIATLLGMHRRTLDRRLKQFDLRYGDIIESVKHEAACQLLRDTRMQMQQVAEALRYSNAANFSTAFRRWTGISPSEYRRQAR